MTISNEMIEAAARAIALTTPDYTDFDNPILWPDDFDEQEIVEIKCKAEAALEAAEKARPVESGHMSDVTKMVVADQKQPVPVDKPSCGAQTSGKVLTPAKHTPLPWRFSQKSSLVYTEGSQRFITVADCSGDMMTKKDSANRNAAYIVEACNSYPALKARIEELERELEEAATDLSIAAGNAEEASKRDDAWRGVGDILRARAFKARAALKKEGQTNDN